MVGCLAGDFRTFSDEKDLPAVSLLVTLSRRGRNYIQETYPVSYVTEIVDGLVLQLVLLFRTALEFGLRNYGSVVSGDGLCIRMDLPVLIIFSMAWYSVKSSKSFQDYSMPSAWVTSNQ